MKNYISNYIVNNIRYCVYLFLFFLLLNIQSFGQDSSTVITRIRVNETEIPESSWGNLKLNAGNTLIIDLSVNAQKEKKELLKYKVLLDQKEYQNGAPQTSPLVLSSLSQGNHILRVHAYFDDGSVATPITLKFNIQNVSDEKVAETTSLTSKDMLLIIALIIIIVLLIVIVVVSKQKNVTSSEKSASNKNKASNAAEIELKGHYDRMKESFEKAKDENTVLIGQINFLRNNMKLLEEGNSHLMQQKEQLLQSKDQLEALQIQKEEFYAITMHDLKNPAGAIKGLVELLDSYDLNAVEQQEVMISLIKSSEHIIKLAQEVSFVVNRKEVDGNLNIEKIQLKTIIDNVYRMNLGYANTKKVVLVNNAPPNLPEVEADGSKIEEVLDNLVNNAVKFAPKDTMVQIRAYFNETKVTVEIVDNGVGISGKDLEKAFQRGSTLSSKPTGGEKSSGVGLWAVKKLVEMHGGKVWVKSGLGTGSTFAFELLFKSPVKK